MKALVVYWSENGHTKAMAEIISNVLKKKYEVTIADVTEETPTVEDYDVVALGCPAQGAENIDPLVFEPYYESIKNSLKGKKVLLFGSYGWGGGEYMQTWLEDIRNTGAKVIGDGLAVDETDENMESLCTAYASEA